MTDFLALLGVVEGSRKCLIAKRSSHLNVETELRIKWCGEGDSCINVEVQKGHT